MENFKEGYYWTRFKEDSVKSANIQFLTANISKYYELIEYLGANYEDFRQLFKIKTD